MKKKMAEGKSSSDPNVVNQSLFTGLEMPDTVINSSSR
jgi:hypothetical protein